MQKCWLLMLSIEKPELPELHMSDVHYQSQKLQFSVSLLLHVGQKAAPQDAAAISGECDHSCIFIDYQMFCRQA